MRYVFGLVCILMLLAAAVQYDDPDGLKWAVAYIVPALWAGTAAWRPERLATPAARALLVISLATAVILVFVVWPPAQWWRHEVWTMGPAVRGPEVAEQAREGMGMMIIAGVLLLVLVASLARRPSPVAATAAP